MLLRAVGSTLALACLLAGQGATLHEQKLESLQTARAAAERGEHQDSADAYQAALEISYRAEDPPLDTARIHKEFADFLRDDSGGESVQAEEHYAKALELRRSFYPPARVEVAESLIDLGNAVKRLGRSDEALGHFSEAADLRRGHLGVAHRQTMVAQILAARVHISEGRWGQATTVFRRAVSAVEREHGDSEELANALDMIATGCPRVGRSKEIIALRSRALAIRETLLGADSVEFVRALRRTAGRYRSRASDSILREEATRTYQRAIEILAQRPTTNLSLAADTRSLLARTLENPREQESELRVAIAVRREADIWNLGQADDECALGGLLAADNRHAEAIDSYDRCLELNREFSAPTHSRMSRAVKGLSDALRHEQRYEEAEAVLRARIAQLDRIGEASSQRAANNFQALGDLLVEAGQPNGAVEAYERMVTIREADWGTEDPRLLLSLQRLAQAYAGAGRMDDAQQTQNRASILTLRAAGIAIPALLDRFELGSTETGGWLLVAGFGFVGLVVVGAGAFFSIRLARRAGQAGSAAPVAPVTQPDQFAMFSTTRELHRFAFHGQGGELFGIWLVNTLKTIVTLGIYYFWGKVKIRRYLWSHSDFSGDRFAFHGTAMELFIGWLKASPLLVFVIWGPQIAVLAGQPEDVVTWLTFIGVGAIALLWPIAEIGAHRYRLTRTSWRGVQFSFHGRTWKYFTIYLLNWPLWLLTLGLWTPFFNALRRRYVISHMRFGDSAFECDAEGSDMFGPYVLNWFLYFPTLGIYSFWYTALRERYYWSRTTYRGARFRSTITGGELFQLGFFGGLITLLTLGLASPWVRCWRMRVWLAALQLDGDLDLDAIRKDEQDTTATAEGVADFFGLDFGFFE